MANNNDIRTPNALLRLLLDQKGWTQEELALIINRPRQVINEILAGRRRVTAEMAVSLAAVFSNDPSDWLKLDIERQLSLVKAEASSDIGKRMKLFELAPIRDMQRRGWIADTKNLDELEDELRRFYETDDFTENIGFPVAARRTMRLPRLNRAEQAWCFKARHLARALCVKKFQPARLEKTEKKLRMLAAYSKEAYRVPEILSETGIRFVIIELLPSARIDGAAFWLDEASPVIAMSLRYDRIDNFWFTLLHEYAHIRNQDAVSVDTDIEDGLKSQEVSEKRANEEAAAALIPPLELESFIRRVGPLYSKPRIIQFAHRIKIHPGIIAGQLYHKGEIGPGANRGMLTKIRTVVLETALTDGWGTSAPNDDVE